MARHLIKRNKQEERTALLLFLPFGLLFFVFTILPVVSSAVLSLSTFPVIQPPVWVGFQNYKYLFTQDTLFLKALTNTFTFAVLSGIIGYMMSFLIAWTINNMRGKMVYALAFYAPSITSGIAMSIVWLSFFSSDAYGFINSWMMRMGIIESPILWTKNPEYITFVIVFVSVWMGMGSGFLAFLAGFQNLSAEISEAGLIDGVKSKFQELIYIILPQMKPMLLFGAITSVTNAFNIFEVPLTMVGSPGPENASLTLVGEVNDYAFTRLDLGYASSIAMMLFGITFLVSRVLFRALSSKEE